jgi:hypothetical protein
MAVEKPRGSEPGWANVEGAGRCSACRKENTVCRINVALIEKWREDYKNGVWKPSRGGKAPTGTGCERCLGVRKQRCELPATEEMRAGLPTESRRAKAKEGDGSSVVSSGKRRLEVPVIELPRKKIRLGTPEPDTRVSEAMVEAMRAMEAILGRVAESSVRGALANEKLARAIDRLAVVVAESAANTLSIGKGLRELAEAGREKEVAESKGKGKEKEESTDSGETAESGDVEILEVEVEDLREKRTEEAEVAEGSEGSTGEDADEE